MEELTRRNQNRAKVSSQFNVLLQTRFVAIGAGEVSCQGYGYSQRWGHQFV
ncbi:MAG TPA: hypothetical protein V6C57_29305 [Coleofasciculaceae cyanobacterium]